MDYYLCKRHGSGLRNPFSRETGDALVVIACVSRLASCVIRSDSSINQFCSVCARQRRLRELELCLYPPIASVRLGLGLRPAALSTFSVGRVRGSFALAADIC